MKFYQLTPMKIDKFQTIYEIIDILFNSLYFANIPSNREQGVKKA